MMETMRLLDSENNGFDNSYKQLNDTQEQLLAILPIPSALLSICGGLIMFTTAIRSRRSDRPWTPYQGLMTSLSICNIISSLTVASGAFMYSSETSNQVWAFGNHASCTLNAFFSQFSTSALLYNGMLSYFFLLRLRFEHHVTTITYKFEPAMHIFALGYPLVTAFLGLFLDVYGERAGSPGCAIRTCPVDHITGQRLEDDCILPTVDLVFRRSIDFFVIISMIVNTVIIISHLNTVIRKHFRLSRVNADLTRPEGGDEEENVSSEEITRRAKKVDKHADHAKFKKGELLEVKLQGAFFLGSYVICNFATIALQMMVAHKSTSNGSSSYKDELEVPYRYFPLMVLQAIFFPLMGFFNCIAYIKPSLARTRNHHKNESMLWVFRRTVFGENSVAPTNRGAPEAQVGKSSIKRQKSKSKSMLGQQQKLVSFRSQEMIISQHLEETNNEDEDEDTDKLEGSGTDETSGSDQDVQEKSIMMVEP